MLSVDFKRVKGATAHEAEMRRQAKALFDNGWRPDARQTGLHASHEGAADSAALLNPAMEVI